MKLIDVYAEAIANWVSGGNLVNRDKISLLGIRPLYDRFLTNGYITKVWCINALPVYYNKGISLAIRREMFELMPSVKTVIHTVDLPVNINVMGDVFRRQMARAAESYNRYRDVFEAMREDEQLTGSVQVDANGNKIRINAQILNSIKQTYDSYKYVYQQVSNGQTFYNTYYFIQASAKTKREIRLYAKHLKVLLEGQGIIYTEVKGTMSQYLNNYCPNTFIQEPTKRYLPMLFSQENIVSTMSYKTKGLVGDKGILLGNDVQTSLPFWLDFTGSGAAQVCLLLAKSGNGKTYIAFLAALGFAGINIHWSAIDIKGNEWYEHLHELMNIVKISMDDVNGRFVNFLRLDDMKCTSEDCVECYDSAVRDTIILFTLMTNLSPSEGNPADLTSILETAVNKVFASKDVVKTNPATFIRTKNLKYEDVLDIISELMLSNSYSEEKCKICGIIRDRCSVYLSSEGRYSNAFKHEITVTEILNTPGVVYAFNKNAGVTLDTLDSIRVHMAQGLDGRKTLYRKRKHQYTAAFYEELQRCEQLETLVQAMSARVTGSRSDNVIIFLLLNAISAFDSKQFAAIKSNITTMLVGKVQHDDIDILVNTYGCAPIKDYITAISEDANEKYRNNFAVYYDIGYKVDKTIIKATLPQRIEKLFETRDIADE